MMRADTARSRLGAFCYSERMGGHGRLSGVSIVVALALAVCGGESRDVGRNGPESQDGGGAQSSGTGGNTGGSTGGNTGGSVAVASGGAPTTPPEVPACVDGGGGESLHAYDYDQSCTNDSDCVAVGSGSSCLVCELACPNATINRSDEARYRKELARLVPAGTFCGCPARDGTCCIGGSCHLGGLCMPPSP
jgi:hypothetical protein